MDAFRMILISLALYAAPLLMDRAARAAAVILWPIAFLLLMAGISGLLLDTLLSASG